MKLIVISRIIAKVIEMISRRSCHSWICSPSRGTKTTRIHISAGRFKHLFFGAIMKVVSRFKAHFKFIQSYGYNELYREHRPIDCLIHDKGSKKQCKNSNRQYMTPHKLDYFLRSIQRILPFMNCFNLHVIKQIPFNIYRIAQISLIKLKNCQNYLGFLKERQICSNALNCFKAIFMIDLIQFINYKVSL